jgi:hypothetical protein
MRYAKQGAAPLFFLPKNGELLLFSLKEIITDVTGRGNTSLFNDLLKF